MRRNVDENLRLIDFGKYRDVKSHYDEALDDELSKYSKGLIVHAEETSLFEEATSFDGDLQAKIAECAERFETLEQKRLENMKNGSKLVVRRYKIQERTETRGFIGRRPISIISSQGTTKYSDERGFYFQAIT